MFCFLVFGCQYQYSRLPGMTWSPKRDIKPYSLTRGIFWILFPLTTQVCQLLVTLGECMTNVGLVLRVAIHLENLKTTGDLKVVSKE